MAVNIVTGMTGIEHITSHDDRARNASQFGRGKYVFDIGRKFSATAVDDNLVRIQDGMCINQGTQMGIEPNDYADVEIDNGLLGTNRHDIIVMRYEKNEETLLEKASLVVVKGVNSSEPVDPNITEGNILDGGDLADDMPLYRVVIEGVNLVSVEPLFEVFDGDVGSILEELDNKVDKVTGKGLSTNDYTNEDKTKLDGIDTGAEVNVQSDWSQNDNTADDFIKHKPGIPSKTSDLQNDSDFVSDANYVHTDNNYTNADKEDVKKIDDIENISVLPTSTVYEVTSIALYGGGMVEALNNESAIGVSVGDYIYAKNDISKKFNFGYEVTKTLKAGYYRVKSVYSNGHAVICVINSSTVPDPTYGIVAITELEKSLVIEKMDIDGKVDKVDGKGLSTNDYTDADKEDVVKIDTLETNQTQILSDIEDIEHSLSTTKTVTGNPISISDSAHVNAEELTVELEPIQDLHGYDSPWPAGGGKNKLPLVLADIKNTQSPATSQGSWSGDSYITNGVTFKINIDNGGNVISILATGSTTSDNATLVLYGTNMTSAKDIVFSQPFIASNGAIGSESTFRGILWGMEGAFIDGEEVSFNAMTVYGFGIRISAGYTLPSGGVTFYPMIRLSTETDPTFEPYTNICPISGYDETSVVVKDTTENPTATNTYTLQFGDTVYGAEVDFVRGVATVDRAIVEYDGSTDEVWNVVDSGNRAITSSLFPSNIALSTEPTTAIDALSNLYPVVSAVTTYSGDLGFSASGNRFEVSDGSKNMNADTFKSQLSQNPLQICYKLVTPTTIQLTPQQIKMLKGNNVLTADGDMELTYQEDSVVGDVKEWAENEFLPKASETAQHNYSTQEQVVGTWIDGSTLYEKSWILSTPVTIEYNSWTSLGIAYTGINKIVYSEANNASMANISVIADASNDDVKVMGLRNVSGVTVEYLTLRYTKTTD